MITAVLAIVVPLQIIAGHEHGANVYEYQPIKLAAMEGHWETYENNAPLVLFGFPNEQTESNDFEEQVEEETAAVARTALRPSA